MPPEDDRALALPLPLDSLPASVRRFCDPTAPPPARLMAARGVVPVKGAELLLVISQLAYDSDGGVAQTARKALAEMPENVLASSLEGEIHPAVLHHVALELTGKTGILERIVVHPAIADGTLTRIAASAAEVVTERIALNESRLLAAPEIVEALYKNRNTRMSTCDRMIELCARNGVRVPGIPAFDAIAESLGSQLIPEPSDEALPSDRAFNELLHDEDDEAYEDDDQIKKKYQSAAQSVAGMSLSEKIRAATVGSAIERAILVRDSNRMVAAAVIDSPRLAEMEAVRIGQSKNVAEDVLRALATRRDFMRLYALKHALVFNPKTPLNVSLGLLLHLRDADLKALAKSHGVQAGLVAASRNVLARKQKKEK